MVKKLLVIAAIAVVVVGLALVVIGYFFMRGPDLSAYEALRNPRIAQKPDQKMLEVKAVGDPNTVGLKAFALLFKAYYKSVKGGGMAAPRARWPKPFNTPASEWLSLYGLPVPATLEKLSDVPQQPGYEVCLTTWQYGDVAEILHVGPYSEETPTIERLHKFIADQGYAIAGPHEEEYLRGPSMFGKGDPKKYYTIIRYRVEKAAEEKARR